ncbi:MAG: PglZ domain-containing protein, partial [Massilibacteroides sp.]|nr:PglZ domain-containing protein [Massilibacteroides sp.]
MSDKKESILWADDEIDLLRPHILFLEAKGYEVTPVISGQDAIDCCQNQSFDIIFLDENMPGLSGLETLVAIKEIVPQTPVVMVTKNEEESIMDQAIGNKIADYLLKPVNPLQLVLAIKKNLHKKDIISETTTVNYQQEFSRLSSRINDRLSAEEWKDIYKRLAYWELELEQNKNPMAEILHAQKKEACHSFVKYVKQNYVDWLSNPNERPVMSHDLMKKKVFPLLDQGDKVFFVLIDNFRFDQWLAVKNLLETDFTFEEDMYYSILPTATQYARNAIFSGLLPDMIAKMFPELWVDEESEEGKNLNEKPLIQTLINRYRKKYSFSYNKVLDSNYGEKLNDRLLTLNDKQLNVIVLNFVDMLSHARTESKMIRELAQT